MSAALAEVPPTISREAAQEHQPPLARGLGVVAANGLLEAGLEIVDWVSRRVPCNQEDIRRRPDQEPIDW